MKKRLASYMRVYGTAYKAIGCVVGILGLVINSSIKNFIINEPPNIHENIYFLYIYFCLVQLAAFFQLSLFYFYGESKKLYCCCDELYGCDRAEYCSDYSISSYT